MRIGGRDANYHKLVFEVRYDQGFTYLDRCGVTANRVMASDAAWILKGDNINPQNAPFVHASTGTQLNFNIYKYDFSLEQPLGHETALTHDDVTTFISQVESISPILHEELSLSIFQRKGFRVWFTFPAQSEKESTEWIASLGAITVAPAVAKALQGVLESQSHVLVIGCEDRKLRVSITPVERLETLNLGANVLRALPRNLPRGQRQAVLEQARAKQRLMANPEFAIMIDVDVFVEEPVEIDPGAYMTESLRLLEDRLPAALGGAK